MVSLGGFRAPFQYCVSVLIVNVFIPARAFSTASSAGKTALKLCLISIVPLDDQGHQF
jgi:hypothetical protein